MLSTLLALLTDYNTALTEGYAALQVGVEALLPRVVSGWLLLAVLRRDRQPPSTSADGEVV